MERTLAGRCLCGDVSFTAQGPFSPMSECHCKQCRQWHGHTGVYTSVKRANLAYAQDRGLTWFASSEIARRGFCRTCGSSLFWDDPKRDTISIAAGSLERPIGVGITQHIYTKDKGDYYQLHPSVPVRSDASDRDAIKK